MPAPAGKTYAVWFGACSAPSAWRARAGRPARAVDHADARAGGRHPARPAGLRRAPGWRIEARTGDTSAAAAARQKQGLAGRSSPRPESLSLLLARPMHGSASPADAVIVDEWHELMGSKRGVQVQLALAACGAGRKP
jgi:ATP-dependent Lhr-like helicase